MPEYPINFVIYGEPASKANTRKFVYIKDAKTGRNIPRFIKSSKARSYLDGFLKQCPRLTDLLEGDIRVHIKIYYGSRRPDLDESVILDAMEGLIYKNDRQVKEKHIFWGLDKREPRAEISVEQITCQG